MRFGRRAPLGRDEDVLGGAGAHRLVARARRKEPAGERPFRAVPIQLREEARGQDRVAVRAPLPLFDADHQPLAIEVHGLEPHDLPDTEPRGARGHQEHPMCGVARGGEEPLDLLDTQDVRQASRLPTRRHRHREVKPLHRVRVEEADRGGRHADRSPREMTLLGQVQQEVLDLRGVEGVRRLVVHGQVHQGGEVQLLGGRRELPQRHLAHHAIT